MQSERKSWGSIIIQQNRLKTKVIVRDKESHYILIKGTLQQEDLILINIYTPNIEAPNYVEQILTDTKGEDDRNTVLVGAFNNTLTSVDRFPDRQPTGRHRL